MKIKLLTVLMAATKILQLQCQASSMLHLHPRCTNFRVSFQHYLSKTLSLLQRMWCLILFFFVSGGHFIKYQLSVITVTHIHVWIFCIYTLVSMSVLCQNILSSCHGFIMQLQIGMVTLPVLSFLFREHCYK